MLGFIKRWNTLIVSGSHSTIVQIARIKRIQEKFVKYAHFWLEWYTSFDLSPFRSRSAALFNLSPFRSRSAALFNLDTLQMRREITRILFVLDSLSGKVSSSPLLAQIGLRVSSYPTRRHEFFLIDYHRISYGAFDPINSALYSFNDNVDLFEFDMSRSRIVIQLKSDSQTS
jgi:hypothetical protein